MRYSYTCELGNFVNSSLSNEDVNFLNVEF